MYRNWQLMKRRCQNPNTKEYSHYGGRGITVCIKWQTFTGFHEDMFSTWFKGATLERIDNSMGYSLDNCRWATKQEQSNNTSRNVFIHYLGRTQTAAQWAKETGLAAKRICWRFHAGWPVEDIFNTRIHDYRPGRKPHNAGKIDPYFSKDQLRKWLCEGMSQREVAAIAGCSPASVSKRAIRWGLSAKK